MSTSRRCLCFSSCLGLLILCSLLGRAPEGLAQDRAVVVTNVAELAAAVESANAGGPLLIQVADGIYTLGSGLWIQAEGLTVAGLSGNRDGVVIQGQGMEGGVSHVFWVAADSVTIRDLTLGNVANHAVQVHGDLDADNFSLVNCRLFDTFEQMVKVSYNQENPVQGSDNGLIQGCLFEYTAGVGPQWYIGGIDAHNATGWIIQANIFRNIASPADSLAEHAVHFWSNSRGTLVERNLIIDCDRGIGFGLGDRGHLGGIIRNNMIYHGPVDGLADVGIGLESASGAVVCNNTIFFENTYPNAIEYRFGGSTDNLIANNLTNRALTARDGGAANLSANVASAQAGWFVDPAGGNLSLASPVAGVVDAGMVIEGLIDDFKGAPRPHGAGIDIGADEYGSPPPGTIPEE